MHRPRLVLLLSAVLALAGAAGAAAGASGRARSATLPACRTGGLVAWVSETAGGGAAGSFYYRLNLTNLSGGACTLLGYPGVSAVNLAGSQIGAAARRESGQAARRITLRNGASASAVLRITDAGDFSPSACREVWAAGLRVYPPGQRTARIAPFPFQTCSRSAVTTLSVRALAAS